MIIADAQRHGSSNILAGKVGDEVMMPNTVCTANHLQSELFSHQFRFCSLFHCFDIISLDNLGSLRL